jgi:uncharacterized membrane protein YfcA
MKFSTQRKLKMSLKLKALLITLSVIASAVAGAMVAAFLIANVSIQTLANICIVLVLGWLVYLFYGLTLNRLEYEETLKKMTEKKG